jgi:hypothetical protein
MEKIFIQIMTAGLSWDKVPATEHTVENVHDAVQTLADVTGCPVRFTRPLGELGIESVNKLNAGYARPAFGRTHRNDFFLAPKAIAICSQIAEEFPELDTDQAIEGSEAVDGLCRIWPNVKYIVESNKKS